MEANSHRHGRWIGLFKLSEECGELVAAVGAAMQGEDGAIPALCDEIGDVRAAVHHAIEANGLAAKRIEDRIGRTLAWIEITQSEGVTLMRRAGALIQLLGKIAAFPDGDEHPDGAGNLPGRLEVSIADMMAALNQFQAVWGLDKDAIEVRGFVKLRLFRQWFPVEAGHG